MEIKDKKKFTEIQEWYLENHKAHLKMKDDCYIQTKALVKEYGVENETNIVFTFNEDDQPCIMDYESGFDSDAYSRNIQSIEYDKQYGGLVLMYGTEQYEYIKYSNVILSDRMYLLGELISHILG